MIKNVFSEYYLLSNPLIAQILSTKQIGNLNFNLINLKILLFK